VGSGVNYRIGTSIRSATAMTRISPEKQLSPWRSPPLRRSAGSASRSPFPKASRSSWGSYSSSDYQPRPALQYCRPQHQQEQHGPNPDEDESINLNPINLVLIKLCERSAEDAVDLSPNEERTKHILSYLNKTTGDTISVGFIDPLGGCKCKAVVLQRQNGGVRLVPKPATIIWPQNNLPEITLILAVPYPARMKYLWPVIASFSAVTRVVIVSAQRSNPEYMRSTVLQPPVYEPLIERGMSQGGRTRPVKVDVCMKEEVISRNLLARLGLIRKRNNNNNTDRTARVFLGCGDEYTTPPPAREVVVARCGKQSDVAPLAIVAIGPERGWTDGEATVFVNECGFKSAMLGSSTLRVDTAVMTGLAVISAALDECKSE